MRHSITPWISLALAASLSLGLSVSAAAQPDTDTALRDASQQFLDGDQAGALETARRGLELAITRAMAAEAAAGRSAARPGRRHDN